MTPKVYQGWSAGTEAICHMIRYFDRVKWKGKKYKSAVNHTYLRFDFGGDMDFIYESFKKGVSCSPHSHIENALASRKIMYFHEQPIECSDEQAQIMWEKSCSLHRKGYDFIHILGLLIAINVVGRKVDKIPWWMWRHSNDKFTCNEFVQTVMLDAGIDPNVSRTTDMRTATRATSSPESQFLARHDVPSKVFFGQVPDREHTPGRYCH